MADAKIPVDTLVRVLTWMGVDADGDEVECMVAHQIMVGYINCYIAHTHQPATIVFHKSLPFPPRRRGKPV